MLVEDKNKNYTVLFVISPQRPLDAGTINISKEVIDTRIYIIRIMTTCKFVL